jgi:hypothetical protein
MIHSFKPRYKRVQPIDQVIDPIPLYGLPFSGGTAWLDAAS